jgi:DNA-binding NarL/FixJ family response regulator
MDRRPVKLLIVDDHPVVRYGLRALFATTPRIEVVGEAGCEEEAVREAARLRPDVVLMDVRLEGSSGILACRQLQSEVPATKVLMLTAYDDDEAVVTSIMAGAVGYLLKRVEPERLMQAVEAVARGDAHLDPVVTSTVLDRIRRANQGPLGDPLATLSEQEAKILNLIAMGKTNKQIAAALFLSEHTVKTYVSTVLQKLQVSRRSEAAAYIARRQSATNGTSSGEWGGR